MPAVLDPRDGPGPPPRPHKPTPSPRLEYGDRTTHAGGPRDPMTGGGDGKVLGKPALQVDGLFAVGSLVMRSQR